MSGKGKLARLSDLSVHLVVIVAITGVIGTIAHGRGGPASEQEANVVEMGRHLGACRLCAELARREAARSRADADRPDEEASYDEEPVSDHAHP